MLKILLKKSANKKTIVISLATMLVLLTLGCQKQENTTIVQQEPQTKTISVETKISPAIINHGNRDKKLIALTFDADMTPYMKKELSDKKIKSLYDSRITETLIKTSTPATIFITGLWAQTYPKETKEISQNQLFEIANHSLTHSSFTKDCYNLPIATEKTKEITETQKILTDITGIIPKYFRFPGGCYGKDDLKLVADLGMESIGWDAISGDAFQNNSKRIIAAVLDKTTNGSIIVMHINGAPNAPVTYLALPVIIEKLKKENYTFVKLSELLKK